MRHKSVLAAAGLGALSMMSLAPAAVHGGGVGATEAPLMIGPGAVSCVRATVDNAADGRQQSQRIAWMLGYVSGYNAIKGGNVLEGTDLHNALAWVDRYCAANPDSKVSAAVDGLISELEGRRSRAAVPAQARGSLSALFHRDDYPFAALRGREEGSVSVSLTIGGNGRVTGCTITSSSRSAALDSTTCRILRSRARFNPASNASGAFVEATHLHTQTWALPDGSGHEVDASIN